MPNFGNGYLDTGNFNSNDPKFTQWEDFVRQLGFSNLANMTDFNSPLYQKYASYLQKTTPGIGANSLLAPLMAGGTGYAGGQAIAKKRMETFSKERQDKINTGVEGFGLNMQQNILSQLGQIGGSFAHTMDRTAEIDQANKTDWGSIMKSIGMIGGIAAAPFTGGASLAGTAALAGSGGNSRRSQPSGVAGYGGY